MPQAPNQPPSCEGEGVKRKILNSEDINILRLTPSVDAIKRVQDWLTHHPLSEQGFALLGELYEGCDKLGESVVAYERAMQLKELSARYEMSPGAWNLRDRQAYVDDPGRALELDGMVFPRLIRSELPNRLLYVGRSLEGDAFLRIELSGDAERVARMQHEEAVLRRLGERGCVSAPRLRGAGWIAVGEVKACVGGGGSGGGAGGGVGVGGGGGVDPDSDFDSDLDGGGELESDADLDGDADSDPDTDTDSDLDGEFELDGEFLGRYIITDFLRRDPVPTYGDIALALLEQRSLGVALPGIGSEDLRYNTETGVCYVIGHGRAEWLEPEQQALRGEAYFEWLREEAFGRLEAAGKPVRHFLFGTRKQGSAEYFFQYFTEGRLDLRSTHAFGAQITTGHTCGAYHGGGKEDYFVIGEREGLSAARKAVLGAAFPEGQGESVLDVGCAGGMVAEFLAERGCAVTAVDIDRQLLSGCRMVANMLGLAIDYRYLHFEYEALEERFDTVLLLSVLNCFKDRKAAAAKAAALATRRILVEIKLDQQGWRRFNNHFQHLPAGVLPDWEAAAFEMDALLPGFRFYQDLGEVDGGGHVLELLRVKEEA